MEKPYILLLVAEELYEKHDVSAEVLDLRSIRPLDQEAIISSVKNKPSNSC